MSETTIASFILRFTQEYTSEAEPAVPWRGVIRHVQSDDEFHFTQLEDALTFIARYVDLAGGMAVEEKDQGGCDAS